MYQIEIEYKDKNKWKKRLYRYETFEAYLKELEVFQNNPFIYLKKCGLVPKVLGK